MFKDHDCSLNNLSVLFPSECHVDCNFSVHHSILLNKGLQKLHTQTKEYDGQFFARLRFNEDIQASQGAMTFKTLYIGGRCRQERGRQ